MKQLYMLSLTLCLWSSSALAEDSNWRKDFGEVSAATALGGQSVPLLNYVPPAEGATGRLNQLVQYLIDSPNQTTDHRIAIESAQPAVFSDDQILVFGPNDEWYIEVSGDGSKFKYRGNIDDEDEIAAAASQPQIKTEVLEDMGRAFVETRLTSLVPLSFMEDLVPLGSRYLKRGGAALEDDEEETIANIAVFGRAVNGIPVLSGSTVAVWFSNAGDPVGFDVEWPEYHISPILQPTLSINDVWVRIGNYANHPITKIQANLQRFECGYVDLGYHKRNAATPIQAGCMIAHTGFADEDEQFKYGAVETIPIGVGSNVVDDPKWPVTGYVLENLPWDFCAAHSGFCDDPEDNPAP